MKHLLLLLLAALALPTAVNANVDPEVHKLCLPAADYLGCIKAMTTKSTDIPSMRMIEGKTEVSGNSCPSGFAYAGANSCRSVVKARLNDLMNIDTIGLYAAGWGTKPKSYLHYRFGEQISKSVFDPNCPDSEPFIYTRSSCESKPTAPALKDIKHLFKGFGLGKDIMASWDYEFERVFGVQGYATAARKYRNK